MTKKLVPLMALILAALTSVAQSPEAVRVEKGKRSSNSVEFLACPDQFAGTISFANFVGQSNDVDLDTLYFCFNDQIDIVHNGDMDLTGDPNSLTEPGVTYAMFTCPPGIPGPNLITILSDGCILDNPPPAGGLWVTQGGNSNGDITFLNDGNLQAFFASGDPILIWFGPITIDDFGMKEYETDPVTFEQGPCVNINTAEAFAVVYLNEMIVSNQNNMHNDALCKGSFRIEGGLPQFDANTFYEITITNQTDPMITGEVVSGLASDGETVIFNVPVAGLYDVVVEDGKSCGVSFTMDMGACVSITASLPSLIVAPGTNICVDVTNEENFIDMLLLQLSIVWDDAVLEFDQVTNLNPNMPGLNLLNSFNVVGNALILSWFDSNGDGVTLPDGDVFFQICFNVIGMNGDCSDLDFSNDPSVIEVFNINDIQIGFNGINGRICVSDNNLMIDHMQDSVLCFGDATGAFTTTVSGGQTPYSISWQNQAGGPLGGPGTINVDGSSFTAPNLSAGSYSVTITDDIGTTEIDTVEVFEPAELELTIVETLPLCNGQNGSLEVFLMIGGMNITDLSPYTFNWSSGDNTPTTSPIPPGAYAVTVTDPKGCTVTQNAVFFDPLPLLVNITFDTATCPGITDGAIIVNIGGGTPDINGDYTIEWPTIGPGLVFQNNMTSVSGLSGDCYPLIITDDNGCQFNEEICIPVHKLIAINPIVIQDVLCTDNCCTGVIELVGVTTGEPPSLPYNFIWNGVPPPPPAIDDQTSSLLLGLSSGVYSVTMQDASGCEIDTVFEIFDPMPVSLDTIDITHSTCFPGNDGTITVNGIGGAGNFTYDWNTVPPSMGATVTGLNAGDYTVTATDVNGCTVTADFTIVNPIPPTIDSLENDTLDCAAGNDGSLTVFATQGDSPIVAYDWSPAGSGMTITGLSQGEYIVTVTDDNGCTDTDTAMVVSLPPLVLDSVLTESPNCPGTGGGNIAVFVSGGTGPYFFDWSNGFNGIGVAVVGGGTITAGDYMVTITDANDCEPLIVNVTLEDPPSIEVNLSTFVDISCPTNAIGIQCDGGVTASAFYSDGTQGNYDFTWGSGEVDNDVPFSSAGQLCFGDNTLTISDGTCFIDTMVTIGAPADLGVDVDLEDASCNGFADGSATLSPFGGTGPYTITWVTMQTGPSINGLFAGQYGVTIEDDNGCEINHNVEINEPEPLTLSLDFTATPTSDVKCPGGSDGLISIIAEGGNLALGDETYIWENNIAPAGSSIASGLAAGTYSVTVLDVEGCTAELTHTVNEPPPIVFSPTVVGNIGCFNESGLITVETVTGGNATTYTFFVDQGPPYALGDPAPIFGGGEHTITVNDEIFGCQESTTVSFFEPQPIDIQLPEIFVIELGDTLSQLDPVIITSLPIDTFLWSPPTQLSCSDCKNPIVLAVDDQLYTLTVVDVNGCSATGQVLVEVDKNRNVYIPNIFSPNDDGINDKFKVYTGIGVENILSFRVFDRWGELLYEDFNLTPSPDGAGEWDGRLNGERMKPAVFVYIIEVAFLDGTSLVYRGDLTLIR